MTLVKVRIGCHWSRGTNTLLVKIGLLCYLSKCSSMSLEVGLLCHWSRCCLFYVISQCRSALSLAKADLLRH